MEIDFAVFGYLAVFVVAAVEGELALLGAAMMAQQGRMSYFWACLVAGAGSWLAGAAMYELARWKGRAWVERKAAVHPKLARAEAWIDRRGLVLVFFARFMWGIRVWIPLGAGACGLRPVPFAFSNFAGAVFWLLVFGPLAYYFGDALSAIHKEIQIGAGVVIATLAAVTVWWKLRGRRVKQAV
jgi:membrane protein DedA with SNARE-associated domain